MRAVAPKGFRPKSTALDAKVRQLMSTAVEHHRAGQLPQAEALYLQVLRMAPRQADAIQLLGLIAQSADKHEAAIALFDKSLAIQTHNPAVYSNRANSLRVLHRREEALEDFAEAIRQDPQFANAYSNRGIVLQDLGRHEEALASFDQAIAIHPGFAAAYSNRAFSLQTLGKVEAALENCERALQLDPNLAEAWFHRGNALIGMQRYQAAVESLDRALALHPKYVEAHATRGGALHRLNCNEAAVESCNRALALDPKNLPALVNRGAALHALNLNEAAVESCDQALALLPNCPQAQINRGASLFRLKEYPAALESTEEGLRLDPDFENLLGLRLHLETLLCDWKKFDAHLQEMHDKVAQGVKAVAPFIAAVMSDSAAEQRRVSEIYLRDRFNGSVPLPPLAPRAKRDRIRIGYFSADYHDHATCHLIAELFEKHDRSKFELIGFSFGRDTQDAIRQRIVQGLDRFLEVRPYSDRDVAQLSRQLEIDIAVDLKGFTADHRIGIFAHRAAPIQVNYLGFPGTLAADFIEYMIADATTIPPESLKHYSEKIAYLPNSYQVNDRKRKIADTVYTRANVGLPESGFVFCSFNSNYKITPQVFDVWMRLLRRVEGSVLWLMEENAWVADNLRKEAVARGIAPERLIFAPRMPLAEHLARQPLADLFLDSLPCNAHTTASDALWAGLPVLTCMGETFASRVAASLLRAIDLPELITTSLSEYEELAVSYAMTPGRAAAMKQRLQQNRLTTPLFDSETYTRHLEAAYTAMYERYHAQLPPEPISIAADATGSARN